MQLARKSVLPFLVALFLLLPMLAIHAAERWRITDEGLFRNGKLVVGPHTRLNRDTLRRLFPGMRVKIDEFWAEGDRYFTYIIMDGGKKAFELEPSGNMLRVMLVYSRKVSDRHGIRPGDTFAKLRRSGPVECATSEEGGDVFLCNRPGENLQYVFKNPDPGGSLAQPPRKARMIYFRWFTLER